MPSTCERIFIDDYCDACGHKDRLGVTFGYHAAVICFDCVATAAGVLKASEAIYGPLSGPDSPKIMSSSTRKG